jgi:uncharacterized protein (TIGR02246 family)
MSDEQDALLINQVVSRAEKFQSDPEQFSQLLTEDAAIVNAAGFRVTGRDEIARVMGQALQTPIADILTRNEVENITFLRPDVAVVNGIKHISVRQKGVLVEDSKASQTFVMVRDLDMWLVALIQSTIIQS